MPVLDHLFAQPHGHLAGLAEDHCLRCGKVMKGNLVKQMRLGSNTLALNKVGFGTFLKVRIKFSKTILFRVWEISACYAHLSHRDDSINVGYGPVLFLWGLALHPVLHDVVEGLLLATEPDDLVESFSNANFRQNFAIFSHLPPGWARCSRRSSSRTCRTWR